MNKKIVVFAGNECKKEKEKYYFPLAYQTGKLLAGAGFVIVSGGGPGLMDQVSRGAFEAKGETIGICIDLPGRIQSKFLTSQMIFDKLIPRQEKLISLGDGFLALPGGIGTLFEIAEILALKRKKDIPPDCPMILIDGYYNKLEPFFEKMQQEGFTNYDFPSLYALVNSPEGAIEALNKSLC